MDSFWDRPTNFWSDKEPRRSSFARSKVGSAVSRRSRRIRARSKRKLASLCALASLVLLVVFVYGLVPSDVGRRSGGSGIARAADGAQAGSDTSSSPQGPVVNARPVASVTRRRTVT
jgi:hypothetical protein